MNEALIEHKVVLGLDSFIIFPQLRLPWKPGDLTDRRSNVPDIGLGHLLPNGTQHLQGGAELKAAVEAMKNLPLPHSILDDGPFRVNMNSAYVQASDQVKSAIKMGAFPQGRVIHWIVAVGPYFAIRHFGPYDATHLATRGHRLNDSGDSAISEFLLQMKETMDARPVVGPLYRIGTKEAAIALHNYLTSTAELYASPDRMM